MRKKVAGGGRSPWVGSWCMAAMGSLPISAPRRGSMWSGSSRRRWCVCSVEPSTVLQAGAGQLVLAGSGCESTRETIEMTSAMAGRIKIKTSREEKRIRRRMWILSNLCLFCTSTSCICWICLSAPLRALYIQTMHISYFHSAHITLSQQIATCSGNQTNKQMQQSSDDRAFPCPGSPLLLLTVFEPGWKCWPLVNDDVKSSCHDVRAHE